MTKQNNKNNFRQIEQDKYTSWYYEHEYWKEDNPNAYNDRYQYDDINHKKRFKFLADLISNNFEFKTFLDVGCGMGHLMRNLTGKGYAGKGIEISKDALNKYLTDFLPDKVLLAGAEKIPLPDNSFDMVICLDVMEHLPKFDIKQAISELIRVSKDFIFLTINLDNPYEYHPSIFTREKWEKMFLANKNVEQLIDIQNIIEKDCKKEYPEYDFFVFKKLK